MTIRASGFISIIPMVVAYVSVIKRSAMEAKATKSIRSEIRPGRWKTNGTERGVAAMSAFVVVDRLAVKELIRMPSVRGEVMSRI